MRRFVFLWVLILGTVAWVLPIQAAEEKDEGLPEEAQKLELTRLEKMELIEPELITEFQKELETERVKLREQHTAMSSEYYDLQEQNARLRIQKAKLADRLQKEELPEEEKKKLEQEIADLENSMKTNEESGMANRTRMVNMYQAADEQFRNRVDELYEESQNLR
ncbi:MAG: hypothetical protein ACOY3K_08180 [Candidatus Omnitrophota bacterium]